MARHKVTVETPLSTEAAFDLLADMTNSKSWDPSVVEAEKTSEGPVGLGTTFRVVVSFAGRKSAFAYRITEYERPRSVTLEASNFAVVSKDRITVEPLSGTSGARAVYDADLQPRWLFALASPIIARGFNKIVDEAGAGLRERLNR